MENFASIFAQGHLLDEEVGSYILGRRYSQRPSVMKVQGVFKVT